MLNFDTVTISQDGYRTSHLLTLLLWKNELKKEQTEGGPTHYIMKSNHVKYL